MVSTQSERSRLPFLGFGLGLRPEYCQQILDEHVPIDWVEILSENYLVPGGRPLFFLDKIRKQYPVVMHGVSLSLGSTDPLNLDYLKQLRELANRVEPEWISDHLCWTGVKGLNMHDLLPLPYTQEAIDHVTARIAYVQDWLKRPLLIENVSSYLTYRQSQMTEWEFIAQILNKTGCYLLLDVNNVYVSAINHGFNPHEFINNLPTTQVAQIHLAGHTQVANYIIDTHDAPIIEPVWQLYQDTIKLLGPISTMIERDDHMPPMAELISELAHARNIMKRVTQQEALMYES